MKIMSVSEIMACEIPEGDYYRGLLIFKNSLIDRAQLDPEKRKQDICFVFSNLYALAQGEYVEKKAVMEAIPARYCNGTIEDYNGLFEKINSLPTIGTARSIPNYKVVRRCIDGKWEDAPFATNTGARK
jgi:hypothetical protein